MPGRRRSRPGPRHAARGCPMAAELPAGVQLDDGEARIPDRDAAGVVRAVIRTLRTGRATGRALGRRPARRAQPPGPESWMVHPRAIV